jgi:hypothetical protein
MAHRRSYASLWVTQIGSEGRVMSVAVVYESSFGNTRKVAEAIAGGLGELGLDVLTLSVDDTMPETAELELVVVGAPTHVHGLSSARSREAALDQGAEREAAGIGVRGWLKELPYGDGRRAAAFDTRLRKPVLLVGSAAKGIARRLEHRGYELVAPPESFFVTSGDRTPLEDGELERAKAWGHELASRSRLGAQAALL